jgi:hypothetical protein
LTVQIIRIDIPWSCRTTYLASSQVSPAALGFLLERSSLGIAWSIRGAGPRQEGASFAGELRGCRRGVWREGARENKGMERMLKLTTGRRSESLAHRWEEVRTMPVLARRMPPSLPDLSQLAGVRKAPEADVTMSDVKTLYYIALSHSQLHILTWRLSLSYGTSLAQFAARYRTLRARANYRAGAKAGRSRRALLSPRSFLQLAAQQQNADVAVVSMSVSVRLLTAIGHCVGTRVFFVKRPNEWRRSRSQHNPRRNHAARAAGPQCTVES